MAISFRRRLRQIDRTRALSAEERARLILDERTEHLASRPDATVAPEVRTKNVLVCGIGRERIGIGIEAVAQVMPYRECMPIPDGPPALVGVFGRGGRLVSVIDLAAALGLDPPRSENEGFHLVLLKRDHPVVALRVERVHAVTAVILLSNHQAGGFRSEAVIGHAQIQSAIADQERVLSLLDTERLLRPLLPTSPVPGA